MPKIQYDEHGGIINIDEKLDKKDIKIKESKTRDGYNFLEKLLIKNSKKVNYLLDKNGKYRCRAQKTPNVIRVGPTNRCTGRCFYCPREYIHDKGTGYMDFALFEKIVSWAKTNRVNTISFALFGEPFLHPRIFDMLDLAVENGMKIRISTNAIILKKELALKLLNYPFESIETSMDGFTREEYLAGKQIDKYEQARKNILYLLKKAKEKKSRILFNVHFVDIGNVSFLNKIRYIKFWKKELRGLKYLTSFYYEPHNWAGARADLTREMNFVDRFLNKWELKKPCMYIKGMNINWNGDVYICTNDPTEKAIIGNVNNDSLEKIYNSEKRMNYLSEHERGRFKDLNCAVCNVNSIRPLAVIKKRIINAVVGVFS